MNKRGFTLVELLATMVILGIIMIIAVPNVLGILNRNRSATYLEDAKKLVTTSEYKFRGDSSIARPSSGNCIVMSLLYLDNSEFEAPPNDGEYMKDNSFVVIKRNGNTYEYYVRLVEQMPKSKGYRGVLFAPSNALYADKAANNVKNITSSQVFKVSNYATNPNGIKSLIGGVSCGSVTKVYAPTV